RPRDQRIALPTLVPRPPASGRTPPVPRGAGGLFRCQPVERADDAEAAPAEDVRVDLRGLDAGVAEERLHRADVGAACEEVGGEGVPEDVGRDGLDDPGPARRLAHGLLDGRLREVMPPLDAGARVYAPVRGREDVLPAERVRGAGVLPRQRMREVDRPEAVVEVGPVEEPHALYLHPEAVFELVREHRDAVPATLPVANDDLMEVEVEVLDAKAEPFHQAEARAIEEADEET